MGRVDRKGPRGKEKGQRGTKKRWERNIKRETEIRERVYLFATHECTAVLPWKRQPLGL